MNRLFRKVCSAGAFLFLFSSLSVVPLCAAILSNNLSEPKADVGTQFIMLGTGGGPPIRMKRSEPSILLLVGNRRYLLDAGLGSAHNLVAAGYHAEDIDNVLITHNHLDHNGGLVDLLEYSSFANRKAPVTILGPNGTREMVHSAIETFKTSRRIFSSEGFATPDPDVVYTGKDFDEGRDLTTPGVIFDDGNVKIFAVENSHYTLMPTGTPSSGRDKSYSFRIETPGRVIGYTGDTGPSSAVAKLVHGADVLITEVVVVSSAVDFGNQVTGGKYDPTAVRNHMAEEHLPSEEIGKLAAAAEVKMVVLTHFSPGMDKETSTTQYTDGVRKYYQGPIIASHDLEKF